MPAVRQDAWTPDDDLILAEVTLRHIREGSTQLAAFEEVGKRIGRTSAACGFRWNSCVRKRYEEAIALAKQQRQKRNYLKKQGLAALAEGEGEAGGDEAGAGGMPSSGAMPLDAIIRHLRHWKNSVHEFSRQNRQYEKLLKEKEEQIAKLKEENERLARRISEAEAEPRLDLDSDDYKALLRLMDRARKLAVLAEADSSAEDKNPFRMDESGNLERVE
jgi:prespore-specific regulator